MKREYSKDDIIEALDETSWGFCFCEELIKWKTPGYFKQSQVGLSLGDHYDDFGEGLMIFWGICVSLFGDYGTSLRSGWIEDVEGFYSFIDSITKTYTDAIKYGLI